MKYFFLFFISIILQGCFSTLSTVNVSAPQNQIDHQKTKQVISKQKDNTGLYDIEVQTVKNNKISHKKTSLYTGSIKGVIRSIKYNKSKKAWIYEVDGLDMSNGKLPYAKFYDSKKLASKGDLVYIVLNNSNLKNLFFIKKANKISKRKKVYTRVYKQAKVKQRKYIGRRKMQLGVPTVENITF